MAIGLGRRSCKLVDEGAAGWPTSVETVADVHFQAAAA